MFFHLQVSLVPISICSSSNEESDVQANSITVEIKVSLAILISAILTVTFDSVRFVDFLEYSKTNQATTFVEETFIFCLHTILAVHYYTIPLHNFKCLQQCLQGYRKSDLDFNSKMAFYSLSSYKPLENRNKRAKRFFQ